MSTVLSLGPFRDWQGVLSNQNMSGCSRLIIGASNKRDESRRKMPVYDWVVTRLQGRGEHR